MVTKHLKLKATWALVNQSFKKSSKGCGFKIVIMKTSYKNEYVAIVNKDVQVHNSYNSPKLLQFTQHYLDIQQPLICTKNITPGKSD